MGNEVSGLALPDAVVKFLQAPAVGILATASPRGRPQATPVWFLLEDGLILVNSSRGRLKLKNMQVNPRVAFTVVDPQNIYRYVQIQGRVVRFERERGARDIDRLSQRYGGRPYQYPPTDRPENRVTILIEPLRFNTMGFK